MVENAHDEVSQLAFKSSGDYHLMPLIILIVILMIVLAFLFFFKRNWLSKAFSAKQFIGKSNHSRLNTLEIKRVTPDTTVIVMEKEGREFTIVESKNHIKLITNENNKNVPDKI